MVVLLVAGTAVGVWMAVEKVFVDRWERQELANHAGPDREGGSPGHDEAPPSAPTARGRGRSGTGSV